MFFSHFLVIWAYDRNSLGIRLNSSRPQPSPKPPLPCTRPIITHVKYSPIATAVRSNPCEFSLEKAESRALDLKLQSKARTTWSSYERSFQKFKDWCMVHSLAFLPATPKSVELYLADLAFSTNAVACVELASAAIGAYHKIENWVNPCDNDSIRILVQGVKRCFGKPALQRAPMTKSVLKALLSYWLPSSKPSHSILNWRSAWLELMLFSASARWGDLAILEIKNFTVTNSNVVICFPKRKNDQEHLGHVISLSKTGGPWCPVSMTQGYFSLLGPLYKGYVVPLISKENGTLKVKGDTQASYQACRREQIAGLQAVGLNPREFGLHSGRIGSTVVLRNANFSMNSISRRVGWAPNSRSVFRYTQKAGNEFLPMNDALSL